MTDSDTCPLCGVRHRSQNALHDAIDTVLAQVSATTKALGPRVRAQRTELADVSARLRRHEVRRQELRDRVDRLRAVIDGADTARISIEELATSLELEVSEAPVHARLADLKEHAAELSKGVPAATELVQRRERGIRTLQSDLKRRRDDLRTGQSSSRRMQERYQNARQSLIQYGHSLDDPLPTVAALDAEVKQLSVLSARLDRDVAAASVSRRNADEEVRENTRERTELTQTLKGLDNDIGRLHADITSFQSKLRDAGFSGVATSEELENHRLFLDRQLSAISDARDLGRQGRPQHLARQRVG